MPFFSNLQNPESHPTGGQSKIRTFFLYLTSFVVIVGGVSLLYFNFVGKTEAVWYDDSWSYRKAITITNHTSLENNVYLDLTGSNAVDTSTSTGIGNYIQSDCGDFRFSKQNGELLPYFLTTACNTSGTTGVHVFFDAFPAGAQTIYLYYGNPSAADGFSASDFSTAATGVTFGSYGSQLKGPSPVLYWKFNDGTGTTAQDSSVQNNDGTTNGPTWEPGGVSSGKGEFSLKFDGSNDLVSKTYSSDTELDPASSNMTVSAWVRHSSTAPGAGTTDTVIARYSSGGYKVYINENGYYCFGVDDDASWGPDFSACSAAAQGSYADSKWHFIEGVKDASTSITLFIDGNQIAQTSLSAFGSISGSSPTFYVGIDSDGTGNPWDGFIDDVKVFTSEQSVRSAAQVKADYIARSTAEGASAVLGQDTSRTNLVNGLVGYWKLDETATPSIDSSGNGNSGSWVTSATNGTGKFGNGIVFNGTSGAINLQSPSILDDLGPFTFSTWVYPNSAGESSLGRFFDKTNTLFFFNGSSSTIMFQIIYSTTNLQAATDNLITLGQWQQVTVTYDGSGNSSGVHIYKNGIEASTYNSTQNGSVSRTSDASNNLYIGNRAGDDRTFDGTMDDVRIYNRALSPSEVRQLYNFAPGPVAYWNMDENTGTGLRHEQTITTAATTTNQVVTGSINADTNQLYITSISARENVGVDVSNVSGGGLSWTERKEQCGGRNQTSVTVWTAFGSPTSAFAVTVDLAATSDAVVVAVSRYSGLDTSTQIEDIVGHNTNGENGACSGGTDNTAAQLTTGSTVGSSAHFVALNPRSTTVSIADADYTQRAFDQAGTGGDLTGLYILDFVKTTTGDDTFNVTLSGSVDWATAGFVIRLDPPVQDRSGNGNYASMNSSMIESNWVPGKFGSALDFDGSDDNVTRADDSDFDFAAANNFTVMAWVKHDGAISTNSDYIFTKADTTTGGYKLYMDPTGDACFAIDDDTAWTPDDSACTSAIDYDDNNWHYFAGVKSGTSSIRLYVDGVEVASKTSLLAIGTLENTNALYMGVDRDGTTDEWDGLIDEVKIYNYARTPAQVVEDMNAGHPAPGSPVGSPVGYWKLDEGYSTNVNDSTQNNNDLTMSSASWLTAGKFNKAWNGTGSVWMAQAADDADFDFAAADDLSISMWFKSDSATNPTLGADQYLLGKGTITNTGTRGYTIYADDNGKINFGICGNADTCAWGASSPGTPSPNDTATSTSDIYDGTWHHIVATKTGTSRIDLYVDGRLNASDTSLTATGSLANAIVLRVGDDDSDATNSFAGDIDEVKIYRLALTADQVKIDLNRGQAVVFGALSTDPTLTPPVPDSYAREYCVPGDTSTCNPPVGEWNFEEGTGTNAYDTSTNANVGVLGTDGAGTDIPAWDSGKVGKSLRFDGSDDDVFVNDSASLAVNSVTYEVWVYPTGLTGTDFDILTEYFGGLHFTLTGSTGPAVNSIYVNYVDTGDNNHAYVGPANAITANQWNHVAFTRTGATQKGYVNGAEVTMTLSSGTNIGAGDTLDTSALDVTIAERFSDILIYTGRLDQIKIFNYARSPTQIAWDYNRGKPVGYWKFDECQGTTANDSAGNSLSGAISAGAGGITSVGDCSTASTMWDNGESGKWNYSLDFDLTDDNVSVTNASRIDFNEGLQNGFTFAAWIYADSAGESNVGRIFDKGTNTYCRTDNPSGSNLDIECQLDLTSTDRNVNVSSAVTTGAWNHVAFVWNNDSDDDVRVYINGRSRGVSSTNSNDTIPADTNNFTIGNNSAGSATFDGKIDDVRIYNYEMTANQIKTLFNQDSTVRYGPATGAP